VLTQVGPAGGTAPSDAQGLERSAAARVLEGRLTETLLGADGGLALSNLASQTLGSLLPKLETHGQLGGAR
jgi:hypothetical protein